MLLLIKTGTTSDELNLAVSMGAGNIRAAFPSTKIKRGVQVLIDKEKQ